MKEGTIIKPYQPVLEIEGKPIAKRGKMSGTKRLIRCLNCFKDRIVPLNQDIDSRCECGGLFVDLLNLMV